MVQPFEFVGYASYTRQTLDSSAHLNHFESMTMKIKFQFSNYANSYDKYSTIQTRAVNKLLTDTEHHPHNILDLGCGTGRLYKSISWPVEHFLAVDFSEKMLAVHPRANTVECITGDFNDPRLFDHLANYPIDRVFAASSLQWATNLEATFANIKRLNASVSLAIFTANTFRTLFSTADIQPILRPVEEVSALARQYFNGRCETVHYTLSFNCTLDMLRYIQRSGVSVSRNILNYRRTKDLIKDYPLDHLEFEVLYIIE